MKTQKIFIILSLFSSFAIQAQNATEIAEKLYNREVPKDGESDMTMILINKKNKKRVRSLHKFFIDLGNVEKQILFFKAPSDVKNTAFMNWSYDDDNDDEIKNNEPKNDDQWLYLPALKKVKRIANSNKDSNFMGSDFTYQDMEKRNPIKDTQRFIKSEKIKQEDAWVIEATPKKEEQYARKIAWISKTRNIPLKIDFYDQDNELLKTLTATEIIKISKYWVITQQEMKNHQKNHKTIMKLTNLSVDKNLNKNIFTQRKMQRGL
ncbi:outer membrane lipoprotein-sorting protein [Tenacibaculum piscium]|uniref:outer membrane lipoprotein-sorting protein n=1 Tax=Tenacibaculum piscium TaxID=1458515 RepID=UPI001F185D0B|nr:outer membrane lipoprotein-sorting protein [Tenacibaculum piscium]